MADFNAQKFWDFLQLQVPTTDRLSGSEQEELKVILSSRTFQKAALIAFQEAKGTALSFLRLDLTAEKGVLSALQLQHKAKGMVRMLEGIIELATEELGPEETEDA